MDPLFVFNGKVILVTGGSRGFGYQMSRPLRSTGPT